MLEALRNNDFDLNAQDVQATITKYYPQGLSATMLEALKVKALEQSHPEAAAAQLKIMMFITLVLALIMMAMIFNCIFSCCHPWLTKTKDDKLSTIFSTSLLTNKNNRYNGTKIRRPSTEGLYL
ncbi:MAG UNVERIFIED_CONTAM: hypothetical protein LVQ98_09535 [Rickettsiaceae bacterium]|jgi:hypothetical protein